MKRRFLFAVAVLVVVAGLVAFARFSGGPKSNPTDNLAAAPRAAVAIVKRGPVSNTLSVAGEFIPYQDVEVHAKVAGYIKRINVDIGDRVKEGQVLAVLEVPELEAQLEGADAAVRHSQQEILRAQNDVARVEADHAALHAAARRLEQAAKTRPGLVAEQELEDAQAKDRAAEAQLEASKAALSAARQQLDVSKANRTHISALSDYSRLTAPFSGVVTWRFADTGALVQAGTSSENSQPVVKLAEVDVLRLRIPVPESLAGLVREGASADVTVQATGEHFTGKVTRFTDALDRSTRTMQVEIDVPNRDYRLSPGMYANVVLQVQNHPDALKIPVQSLNREDGKSVVLLVDSQNRIVRREIKTGIEDPSSVEVLSGLTEGDRVIVGNLGSFQPGQVVVPKVSGFVGAQTADAAGGEQ
ncbi:MAG TPA: efflux RND transporter periplasmic adaptor subunit [Terriglobales bacterium]|nr:efflux RND transporter periplasmic adaptor subunit [Terriglobales bacterium]